MKPHTGFKLRILCYMIIAVISPLLLHFTDPNAFESWSQYAKHWNEIFLDTTLVAAGLTFLEAGNNYKGRDNIMFRLLNWIPIRVEHWYIFTGVFFFFILFTDVVEDYLKIPHFIFTGLAIGLVYGRMWFTKSVEHKIIANAGLLGFLLGFLTTWYTTFWGEYIMLWAGLLFMFNENKKQ